MSAPSSHLLIVSDIHIGEYVKESDRIGYIKGASRQDESLCAFLEYHQQRRIDGKPWRLIINGDFIDFIAVTVQPDEQNQEALPALQLSEDELRWGLDSSAEKAVWKLDRLVDRHRTLFAYLADFIGHGHSVEILYGNHDVEFWWPQVHQALRRHLRRIYFGGESVAGVSEEAFWGRIRFHRWFLYEPGRFYIEHGNQYDDFSSFEYRLHPVAPYDPEQLAMPVSHMAIRYFVNQYRGFRSHNKDNWTLLDYLRWLREQGRENLLFVFRLYVSLGSRVFSYAQQSRASDNDELRAVHEEALEELARETGMALPLLRQVDALRNPPVTGSMARTLQTLGVDRLALTLSWLWVAFVIWVIPFAWSTTALLWLGCALGAWLSHKLLPLVRDRYFGGRVTTHVAPKVDRAAAQLGQLLDVPYLFFGHTHKPRKTLVRQDPPCYYLNSGSWLAPQTRERHGPGDACPSRLTFVVYRLGPEPDARLFRWCARDAAPVPFDPRGGLQHLDPEQAQRAPLRQRLARLGAGKLRRRAPRRRP